MRQKHYSSISAFSFGNIDDILIVCLIAFLLSYLLVCLFVCLCTFMFVCFYVCLYVCAFMSVSVFSLVRSFFSNELAHKIIISKRHVEQTYNLLKG